MRRLAPALALLALVACNPGPTQPPAGEATGSIVDGSVPDFQQRLRDLRGMPVVVNFWATWCVPCQVEMPRLVDAAYTYAGRVSFLGVDVEDDRSAAEQFVHTYGIPFVSLFDGAGNIRRNERVLGLPATQFYRADGEMAFIHHGEITEDELLEKIEETLRAP